MSREGQKLKEARIVDFDERIGNLNHEILQSAFETSETHRLKSFLSKIVRIGAKYADSKACSIFLLEEDLRQLRLYAASGDIGKKLEEQHALYYLPERREPFTKEGEGKKKLEAYLAKKGWSLKKLREQKRSLGEVVRELGDDLEELIENGILPIGITAYVVKTGQTVIRHGKAVREHPEWRGSYEGVHEICTSLIEMPLFLDNQIVGMIKIENHKDSRAIYDLDSLEDPETLKEIYRFSNDHKRILNILAQSTMIAIQQILFQNKVTYKELFGIKILQKVEELPRSNSLVNQKILEHLKQFNSQIKVKIEDIGGLEEMQKRTFKLIGKVANTLDQVNILRILNNIGPAFEPLLGTDVKYREHFMHQFQVFLLGYYLINSLERLQEHTPL